MDSQLDELGQIQSYLHRKKRTNRDIHFGLRPGLPFSPTGTVLEELEPQKALSYVEPTGCKEVGVQGLQCLPRTRPATDLEEIIRII